MPTATTEKEKKTKSPVSKSSNVSKIKVANTEIVIGNIYEVIGKKDYNAPDGFQKFNTTKYLIPGIKEIRGVIYDDHQQRWDTGFEADSHCNKTIPASERAVLTEQYVKLVQQPYEKWSRKDTNATNDEFWNNYGFEIYTGKTFDTSHPKDLFDLFHALKQAKICEVGEKDYVLQKANYCIKNREQSIGLQEQKLLDKAEAFGTFMTLLDAHDPDKDDTLYTILEWMNITNIRGAEKEAIKRTVLKMFDNEKTGHDTILRFLEAYNMSKSDVQKEEMELFSMLNKLYVKRKIEFKRKQFYLEEVLLGNTLKIAAKSAFNNPELKEHIVNAFEEIA